MKRIFKNGSNYIVTEIPEGFDVRDFEPKKTNLEVSKLNDKESQKDFIFYQETIPECEQKYWKVENGLIVEMSETEKLEIENKEINNSFHGFKHKITLYDQKAFLEENVNFIKFDREVKTLARNGKAVINETVICIDNENQRFRTEMQIFIDYINVEEMDYIKTLKCISDSGEEINIVNVEINPIFDNSIEANVTILE